MRTRLVVFLLVLAPPGSDALDDEQALAGLDVAEPSRLAGHRLGRVRLRQSPLEPQLLLAQRAHFRGLLLDRIARSQVAPQRLPVEERDERERAHAEPAEQEPSARDTFL